jgi:hypothetical protein
MKQPDPRAVVDIIVRFGRALDDQDWVAVRQCLAPELDTDYSSFRGTPPARSTAEEFVRLRQTGLAGLVTQHLTVGHVVEATSDGATCRCDFVIHRWPVDASDRRFLHSYGYYVYRLEPATHGWRIAGITQIVRRSDGDPRLHGALRPG